MAYDVHDLDDYEPETNGLPLVAIISSVVAIGIVAVGVTMWLTRPELYKVASDDMAPTLVPGEYVTIDNSPNVLYEKDDIVLMPDPLEPELSVLRRIIGFEGDVLEWRNGSIYINQGELRQMRPRQEQMAKGVEIVQGLPGREEKRVVVGENEYFVLGDNWGSCLNSFDFGPISRSRLQGKALAVRWPIQHRREID